MRTASLRDGRAALAVIFGAGLALRISVLGWLGYPSDPTEIARLAAAVQQHGLGDLYAHVPLAIYPAVLYLLGPLAALFSGEALYTAVKGISIPFDLLIGVALYLIGRRYSSERTGVVAAGLYLLNPAAIIIGPLWGQLDSIGILCILLALIALADRRYLAAGLATVLAGMVKATFGAVLVVVGPVVLIEAFRHRDWRLPLRVLAGGLVGYALIGPVLRLSPLGYLDIVRFYGERFAYSSLNAFNLWAAVVGFFEADRAIVGIGIGLALAGVTASLVPLWRRRDLAALLAITAAVTIALYYLPTRVHERYYFPVLVLLAPLAAARPRLRAPYAILSLAFATTLGYSLWNVPYGHRLLPGGLDAIVFSRVGLYVVGLSLAGASAWSLWLLARGECTFVPVTAGARPAWFGTGLRRAKSWVLALHPLVAAVVVFNAVALWPELTPVPNLNDDSYQFQLVVRAADALVRGEHPLDHWLPTLELGFPVFLYYQQLPHLAVVALSWLTLGAIDLRTMFDLVRYALLVGLPVTAYASLRWMGLSRTAAAAAGAAAALFSSDHRFGLEYDSYLWRGFGLYTQLWAVHLSYVALAAMYRLVHRGGHIVPAVFAATAVVLVHLLYGYMLAISTILIALVGLSRTTLARRAIALPLSGVLIVSIVAYLVPPYLGPQAYLDVSQFLPRFRWDSFGAPTILGWLVTGDLFDHGRLPVLTVLTAVGIVIAAVRRARIDLTALMLFFAWLGLYFGPASYGPLANLLPLAGGLPIHRFVGSVEIAATVLIGIAAEWIFARLKRALPRRRSALSATALAAAVLLPVMAERWTYAEVNRAWIGETVAHVAADPDVKIIGYTLALLPQGRVYAGLQSNWGRSLDFGVSFRGVHLYDVLSARGLDMVRPPTFSFSLNSDVLFDFDDRRLADYQVFGVRYVVAPAWVSLPSELRQIAQTSRYTLYEAPTTGYAMYVALAAREQPRSQADLVDRQRRWLASDDPARGRYLRFDYPAATPVEAPVDGCSRPAYLGERIDPARIEVSVSCPEPAALAFKTTYHPNWRVTVDGVPQTTFMVSPSYLAAVVPPGRHIVVAEYRAGAARTPLVLSGLAAAGAIAVLRRRIEDLVPAALGWWRKPPSPRRN